ncbi:site-specific integrase [Sphingomonas sp. NBWT7]|uniref:site-specific integrase n=1 Tax=Sphingomonas sp. NBWT7 TaxID=2596913 RepID=UPI0021560E02|nr:site-specific integrase [Sphingomonas sp. NBWT7]
MFASADADAGTNPRTIGKRISAIAYYHRQAGHAPPNTVPGSGRLLEVLAGIRATHGKPKVRKRAADAAALRHMLDTIQGDGLRAVRDRALLAIGMSAALRRSELVAFDVPDVALVDKGIELLIAKSKTDQTREGVIVAIPEGKRIRPKALLLAWMAAAGHAEGPLFRRLSRGDQLTADRMSDRAIARLVQRCAAAAGYDPAHYAGHSLRAGFLTEAAANRASIFKMQDVSRHKSVQVLSEYVRSAELFDDHAGAQFL